MNFTQLLSNSLEEASTTIGAINSFSEYISSKFTDLANFVSGNSPFASVYINEAKGALVSRLGVVPAEVYQAAIEEPSKTFVIQTSDAIEGVAETIEVAGQDLVDAFDEQLSNLKCQEQYISYCLTSETASVSEFLTRAKTVSPGLSGAVLDKYSRLIEISGSPLECLRNLFGQYQANQVKYENQIIQLVDPSLYVGNIWESAWTVISETVSSFFAGVWRGIQDIGGFFDRLMSGIVNLGKWIVSHAFSDLATAYEKASSCSVGTLDLPIFQFVGTEAEWQTFFNGLVSNSTTTYSWDGRNHCLKYSLLGPNLMPSLKNLIADTFEGTEYRSICEVVVPGSPCDISLRVGMTNGDAICLAGYVVSDYGSWSKYDDNKNSDRVWDSLREALRFISSVVPLVNFVQDVDDMSPLWTQMTDYFVELPSTWSLPLPRYIKHLSTPISSIPLSDTLAPTLASIIAYMCLMSKGFRNVAGVDVTNAMLATTLFSPSNNLYTPSPDASGFILQIDSTDFDLTSINSKTFRPYSKRNQLPVTIHYQTTDQQAAELLKTILKMAISVVATVATIKFVKWSKRRQKDTVLAHAQVDKLSWDIAANPSPENLAAFNKAWKRSKNIDFVNRLLGVGVGSGGDSSANLLGSLAGLISKTQSDTKDVPTNIQYVVTLIKG